MEHCNRPITKARLPIENTNLRFIGSSNYRYVILSVKKLRLFLSDRETCRSVIYHFYRYWIFSVVHCFLFHFEEIMLRWNGAIYRF